MFLLICCGGLLVGCWVVACCLVYLEEVDPAVAEAVEAGGAEVWEVSVGCVPAVVVEC